MNQFRSFAVWIVIALLLFALFSLFQGQSMRANSSEISYSDFLSKINNGEISSITASMNGDVVAKTADGRTLTTYAPVSEDFLKTIREKNVAAEFRPPQSDSFLSNALIYWLPM